MSSRARRRKAAKQEVEKNEQQMVVERRKERLDPIYAHIKRVSLTVVGTAILLVVGMLVNNHLGEILNSLK